MQVVADMLLKYAYMSNKEQERVTVAKSVSSLIPLMVVSGKTH